MLAEVAAVQRARCVDAAAYLPSGEVALVGRYVVRALGTEVEVECPLRGAHQRRNVALAIAAAVELAERHDFPVSAETIAEGVRQTCWPGRLEQFAQGGVNWILDVAHNPAGARALREGLEGLDQAFVALRPRILVFSCLRDKPVAEMARILFPLFDHVVFAPIHTARATAMDELLRAGEATGVAAIRAGSVAQALQVAVELAHGGVVVVSGSVYLVGEARSLLVDEGGGKP